MTRRFAAIHPLDTNQPNGWGTRRRRAWHCPWRAIRHWAGILGTVAIAAAWFITLRPTGLGGSATTLIVKGTSMEPTLDSGDLVIANRNGTYDRGDVVAFRVPEGQAGAGSVLIHRIVGGNGTTGYTTQGDNSPSPDPWLPTNADIIGTERWHIPAVGRISNLFRSARAISMLTGIVAGSLVYSSSRSIPAPAESCRRPSVAPTRATQPAVQRESARRPIPELSHGQGVKPLERPPPLR